MIEPVTLEIRVRGRVQGVGFRPNVYRIACELGLSGEVLNDAEGVLIRVSGPGAAMTSFLDRIASEAPPLARVQTIETRAFHGELEQAFRIVESAAGVARTEVAPDAKICADCAREVLSPEDRRFRYAFAACTHCGPRLTVVTAIPYDRATTTMARFPLCALCEAEYRNPADRRFHAEATACPACGPTVRLAHADGRQVLPAEQPALDSVDAALAFIDEGAIVAIKGLGGYHLACDATNTAVVMRLRERKQRDAKPFALMARDLTVVRRYCIVDEHEERLLAGPAGPIVLLAKRGTEALPEAIAPGHRTLGFMLPTTPLHLLLLLRTDRPVVMTSGNLSEEPPVIDDGEARTRLASIADYVLSHDRPIANRVDDSVVRVMGGRARSLRRARGYAPASIRLPGGFDAAPPLLSYGGDLKATFCFLTGGDAVLSQHQGDLENRATLEDYEKNLALYAALLDHRPRVLVTDRHPDYASTRLARARALRDSLQVLEVQHHHAHAAACLAENGRELDAPPVLAVVLDGLGLGEGAALWGGEFLLADYRESVRLGTFAPVALIGGDQAAREPWRNLYAHLVAGMGWAELAASFSDLELYRRLSTKPRTVIDRMLEAGLNVPRASSCGRLFDAVAAAVGITFDRQAYEGQSGALLEAAVDARALGSEGGETAYPFEIRKRSVEEPAHLDPSDMWRTLLGDLKGRVPTGVIAARFHRGLARAIREMVVRLRGERERPRFDTVALSGGCFQNRVLFEETERRLRDEGFAVLSHAAVPANDGGIALGQAAIAAARLIAANTRETSPRSEVSTGRTEGREGS